MVITAVAKFFADLMLLVSWVRKRCVVHSYDLQVIVFVNVV